jgi:hypothetical protein
MMAKQAKKAKKRKAAKPKQKQPANPAPLDHGVNVAGRPAMVAALHGSGMTPDQAEAIVAALEHYLGIAGAPVANA